VVAALSLGKIAVAGVIGVAQATADVSSTLQAGTRSAVITTVSGGLTIWSFERAVATGTSVTAALAAALGLGGGASGAGARQDVSVTTATTASVDGGNLEIAGALDVEAISEAHGSARSLAIASMVGLIGFAGAGSVATSTVAPAATASISSATVTASGVFLFGVVRASSKATADAYAFATILAVGASRAIATLAPAVEVSITESDVTATAGAIFLEGLLNAADDGNNTATDEDGVGVPNSALATATASVGAAGASGGGAHATATDSGIVAVFTSGGTLAAAGVVNLTAASYAAPLATTRAIDPALGVSIGSAIQTATANGSTRAVLGSGVSRSTAIDVTALATMAPRAEGGAFGGAVVGAFTPAGSTATLEPNADDDPSVQA
jgi:hypothetical protein